MEKYMLRDSEMRRILVRLFKKQKKRYPPIHFCQKGSWYPVGDFFEEYQLDPPREEWTT